VYANLNDGIVWHTHQMFRNFTRPPVFELASCDGDAKTMADNREFIDPMNLFDSNVTYLTGITQWLATTMLLWNTMLVRNQGTVAEFSVRINLTRSILQYLTHSVTHLDEQIDTDIYFEPEPLIVGEPILPKRLYRLSQWSDEQFADYFAHLEYDGTPERRSITTNQDLINAVVKMRRASEQLEHIRVAVSSRINYLGATVLCDVTRSVVDDAEDSYLASNIELQLSMAGCGDSDTIASLAADVEVARTDVQLARNALRAAAESRSILLASIRLPRV